MGLKKRTRGLTLGTFRDKDKDKEKKKRESSVKDLPVLLRFDPFSTKLPPLVEEAVLYLEANGLHEKGLFRVPGFMAQVKEIKAAFDKGERVNLQIAKNVATVASLLKYWLSELPEPLLTFELIDCFMLAVDVVLRGDGDTAITEVEPNILALRSCIRLLPPGNKTILLHIIKFLAKVAENKEINSMNASNIATCFSPILVRRQDPTPDMNKFLEESKKGQQLVETLIEQYSFIFELTNEESAVLNVQKKPIRADFVEQMERGTKILASNLIKRENEKQKLLSAESDLEFSVSVPNLKDSIDSPTPERKVAAEPRRSRTVQNLRRVQSVEASPQRPRAPERRAVPERRKPPSRASVERLNLTASAEATQNEDVQKLAELLLNGNMNDAGTLLKQKYVNSNVVSYEGEKNSDGEPHGIGKMIFTNGDVYEGNFINSERTGKAKLSFNNGNVYEGDFVNGLRHGYGVYVDYKGNRYEGDFSNGKRTGYGKLIFASPKHIYEGNFKKGVPQGFGKTTFSNGDIYEGEHDADERHGFGIFQGANGGSYRGSYVRGKRDGIGYYISAKGGYYKGLFKNNAMHGFGKYVFNSGDVYIGQFVEGKFQGKGRYSFSNGTSIEGSFQNGEPFDNFPVQDTWLEYQLQLATRCKIPPFPFTLNFDDEIFKS